jgi:acetoacetyl-CoA synthetase
VTFFGAGAAFFANCLKAGVDLATCGDLSRARAGHHRLAAVARGAAVGHGAVSAHRGPKPKKDIWWCNISGGTDFAGAFIGGNRELPQVPGEMQCRLLGCAVEAWNEAGRAGAGRGGRAGLHPADSVMPLYFWGDTGNARYLQLLRDVPAGTARRRYPAASGAMATGSSIGNPDGSGCVIYGRSDATINRHGLRMGTSELYSAVEALPEVLDSMVVDLEYLGRESYMPLFVVLREGVHAGRRMRARSTAPSAPR